jgi:hypothetical protein
VFVAVRARRWDLASYLAGVPLAAIAIALVGSPWVQGKALAIVSPAVLFAALLGCAWAWSDRRLIFGAGVGALIGAGIVWSNALAYSEVNLAPREQLAELEEIGEMLQGTAPVLMTEYQPYGVRHFLRNSDPEGASELRRRLVPLADGSSLEKGLWADSDDFRVDAFEPYEALVLRRSPEQSRPPGEYELEWAGDFYEVWTVGREAAAERLALGAGRPPVAEPVCADVRELAREVPGGSLRAARGEEPIFLDGISGRVELAAPGAYSVWIEGSVRAAAELTIDGMDVSSVRHQLNNEGLYTELGTADLGAGTHEVSVALSGRSLAPGSGGADESGSLAITRARDGEPALTVVPSERARRLCGQTWDWIEAVR